MLEILATHHQILNEPAQPHQQQFSFRSRSVSSREKAPPTIIVEESVKYFKFGIADEIKIYRTVASGVGRV